jgi:hypothetical protein
MEPSSALSRLSADLAKAPEFRLGLAVTAELQAEAKRVVSACDAALTIANEAIVIPWLNCLGMLCAAAPGQSADMGPRYVGYAKTLDYPAICYTQETLREAAKRFRFFPTVAELTEIFNPIVAPIQRTRFDAARVARATISSAKAPASKRANDPKFLGAMADLDRLRVAEADRQAAARRQSAPLRPNLVANPMLDEIVARNRPKASDRPTGYPEAPEKPPEISLPDSDAGVNGYTGSRPEPVAAVRSKNPTPATDDDLGFLAGAVT